VLTAVYGKTKKCLVIFIGKRCNQSETRLPFIDDTCQNEMSYGKDVDLLFIRPEKHVCVCVCVCVCVQKSTEQSMS
jgi:hypothetical protein